MTDFQRSMIAISVGLQRFSVFLVTVAALACLTFTMGAFAGIFPWMELPLYFDGELVPNAGKAAQVTVTCLALMLLFYLPANMRMMALENSHRKFELSMRDVVHAYHAAHAADRAGMFTMSSEFDEVKERLKYMREHPVLEELEPAILEIAAQMSQVSQELAETYSDDKVDRARAFLRQRQEEVDRFQTKLHEVKATLAEIKQWHQRVDVDESIVRSQLDQMRAELAEVFPELSPRPASSNVQAIGLAKHAAE